MKKFLSLLFITSIIILTGCNSYKKISDVDAIEIGVSLFEEYFNKDVYSSGVHFENEQDKYGLYLSKTKNGFKLKNIFSESKKNYLYNDGVLTIFDEQNNIVDRFNINEVDFLTKYAGSLKLHINTANFSNHQTAIIEKSYSKGNRKYYVLEQKITFKEEIEINVSFLGKQYTFFVKYANFEIDDNQITDIYFDGFQKRETERINIRYFIYKI